MVPPNACLARAAAYLAAGPITEKVDTQGVSDPGTSLNSAVAQGERCQCEGVSRMQSHQLRDLEMGALGRGRGPRRVNDWLSGKSDRGRLVRHSDAGDFQEVRVMRKEHYLRLTRQIAQDLESGCGPRVIKVDEQVVDDERKG